MARTGGEGSKGISCFIVEKVQLFIYHIEGLMRLFVLYLLIQYSKCLTSLSVVTSGAHL